MLEDMNSKVHMLALFVLAVMVPGVGEATGHLVSRLGGWSSDHQPTSTHQHRDSGPELPCTGIHVCPCHPQFQGHTPDESEPAMAPAVPLAPLVLQDRPSLAQGHPSQVYRPPIF